MANNASLPASSKAGGQMSDRHLHGHEQQDGKLHIGYDKQHNRMKTRKKYIVILLFILLGLYIFILIGYESGKSPAGIYISDINCKDTLKLYPGGKFEQIVYNENGILVYSCVSKWSKTTMGIRIDSLLLYDDVKYLNYWKEYPVEGEMYTGLRFEHRGNKDVLSWRYYVDIPEESIDYIRIKEME